MSIREAGVSAPLHTESGLSKPQVLDKINYTIDLVLSDPNTWPKRLGPLRLSPLFYKRSKLSKTYISSCLVDLQSNGVINTTNIENGKEIVQNRFCVQPYDFMAGLALSIINKQLYLNSKDKKDLLTGIKFDLGTLVSEAREILPEDHILRGFIHAPIGNREITLVPSLGSEGLYRRSFADFVGDK